MNLVEQMYQQACERFECQIKKVAIRALGCSMEHGLETGRLVVHHGQPFVDGRQICFVQPPRLRGMEIVWVFKELTGEVKP